MAARNYTNTATEATLSGGITAAATSITLAAFAGFPTAPFTAVIDRGTSDEEVVLVTAVGGSTVTATRGYDSTTAKTHAVGATFTHAVVAKDFSEANVHVNQTTGAHGIVGAPVGTTDTQSLTNKTLVSPAVQSPTITGSATATNLTVSGTATVPTPSSGTHAATKAYVDGAIPVITGKADKTYVDSQDALKANLASPTFTGTVTVPTPSTTTGAATKQYADDRETAAKAYADTLVLADSGWQNITVGSGKAATSTAPQVRKIGKVVYAKGGWNQTGIASNGVTTVGTIPLGYRPASFMVVAPGLSATGSQGRFLINTDGTVDADAPTSVPTVWRLDGISWLVD